MLHRMNNLSFIYLLLQPYTDLQSDLELRTQETEDTLADLENVRCSHSQHD